MKLFGIEIAKELVPVIIIVVAFLVNKILQFIIKKTFDPLKKHKKIDIKRVKTTRSILCNLTKYIVLVIAIFLILSYFGVNTTAMVTGVGVVSLVIGLAFQDMLKDILVGISIIFENQFSVGDYVKIGDFSGTVISLGIKTTRIQAYTGEVKIISNRNIVDIINYSIDNTLAVVDIGVSYEEKIDRVEKILMVCASNIKDKIPNLVDDITLLGVQELSDSSVIFRMTAKCKPAKHFEVERMLKKEFKNCLDKNGIKIPYPQIEVHND